MLIRRGLAVLLLAGTVGAAEPDADEPPHWAYRPLRGVVPPGVPRPESTRNSIDHFVQHRLAMLRIEPAAAADRATLIPGYVDADGTVHPEKLLSYVDALHRADDANKAEARGADHLHHDVMPDGVQR